MKKEKIDKYKNYRHPDTDGLLWYMDEKNYRISSKGKVVLSKGVSRDVKESYDYFFKFRHEDKFGNDDNNTPYWEKHKTALGGQEFANYVALLDVYSKDRNDRESLLWSVVFKFALGLVVVFFLPYLNVVKDDSLKIDTNIACILGLIMCPALILVALSIGNRLSKVEQAYREMIINLPKDYQVPPVDQFYRRRPYYMVPICMAVAAFILLMNKWTLLVAVILFAILLFIVAFFCVIISIRKGMLKNAYNHKLFMPKSSWGDMLWGMRYIISDVTDSEGKCIDEYCVKKLTNLENLDFVSYQDAKEAVKFFIKEKYKCKIERIKAGS